MFFESAKKSFNIQNGTLFVTLPVNFFQVTDIDTKASHAASVGVEYQGADGGTEDVVSIGGLFRLLLSRPTAGLQVLCCLQKRYEGHQLSGLQATSRKPAQPWVPLEEVGKTSTPAGKAAPARAAVKAEESPPPTLPARLKFQSDDEGRVAGRSSPASAAPPLPLRARAAP